MSNILCGNCGSETVVVRGQHQFTESGLSNVILDDVEIVKCVSCGNEDPIIPYMNQLMRNIAVALVSKPCRLVGEEIRYLRKYIGKSAAAFARILDVDAATLSKWEHGKQDIGAANDRLIRLIAVAMGDGVGPELRRLIETEFPEIQSSCDERIVRVHAKGASYEYAYA